MKNQFEQKKIEVRNKRHFVETKTDIMQQVLKMQEISLLPKYIRWIFGVFSHVHLHPWMQVFKMYILWSCGGLRHHVVWKGDTCDAEEHAASIFRVVLPGKEYVILNCKYPPTSLYDATT